MRTINLATIILCLLMAFLPISASGQEPASSGSQNVDWSNPDSIDPTLSGIGDFLDVDLEALQKTANEAYQSGNYEKAVKYYLACVRCNIQDSGSIYNLACCYGLMGNADLAALYLERAVKAGFTDIEWVQNDTDFEGVRGTRVFDDLVSSLEATASDCESALGEQIFTESNALIGCRVRTPENFDPSVSHTLLIGLHGYGSNADSFITLWDRFAAPDFIYAAPETPYAFTGGSELGYSWTVEGPGVNDELWLQSAILTQAYIVNLVSNLKAKYNIDRVFLMGFSQGAFQTYIIGIMNYDLFDGLIVFGGGMDQDALTDEVLAPATGLPIFIAHGNDDRIINIQQGFDSRDKLITSGYDVTWHEFEGGHAVPAEALQAAEVWMKSK